MSFTRNEHGQLCISPQRYIEKMVDSYKWTFKENLPSKAISSWQQRPSQNWYDGIPWWRRYPNILVAYWFDAVGHQYQSFQHCCTHHDHVQFQGSTMLRTTWMG
jgi:hypothetical protein